MTYLSIINDQIFICGLKITVNTDIKYYMIDFK